MELSHRITIAAPVDQVWAAVRDPASAARCLPGLSLTAVDGGTLNGSLRIKLGSTGFVFVGSASCLSRDQDRRLMISARGEDSRGNGGASADVVTTFTATHDGSGEQTLAEVTTQLALTGRAGLFGHGVMSDISAKVLDRFADCLSTRLTGAGMVADPTRQDSQPVATGVGPIGGGAQSGGATGVGISSGAAEPPESARSSWVRTDAPPAELSGLSRHARAAAIGAAGAVAAAALIVIRRRLR